MPLESNHNADPAAVHTAAPATPTEPRLSPAAQAILATARARNVNDSMRYAGAVTPDETHALMQEPGVKVIDVRSRAEWVWVGRIPGSILVPWSHFTDGGLVRNPHFVDELKAVAAPGDVLLMLCRSAKRSKPASETAVAAGFAHAFDVLEGFEGDPDAEGRRNTVEGWRFRGLPWRLEM